MGKLILTADLHNGIPNKLKDTIWSMQVIRKYAQDNNIQKVLILGDLFHDRVNLQIDVLNSVYDFLKETTSKYHQEWICFPGNHDMFLKSNWEINSLRIFRDVITIIEKIQDIKIYDHKFWIIPFMHYESEYMQKLSEVNEKANPEDILLTHIGVNNAIQNECFLLKHWSMVNFSGVKFKRIFAGHFHCHQEVGKLIYPGSPLPFRFDEGLVDHGFLTYDLETDQTEFIKTYSLSEEEKPPDYITLLDKDIVKNSTWCKNNNVRIILSKEYTANELGKLKEYLTKKGAISISWKMVEKTIEENKIQYKEKHLGTPEELFKAYIKTDEPKLDIDLLFKLHAVVSKEAEEHAIVESVDDG